MATGRGWPKISGMKIILTVTNDLVYDQRMIRICTSLTHAGHDVELVGRLRKESPPLQERPYQQTRLRCWFEKGKLFYLEYNLRLLAYLWPQYFGTLCAVDLDTILPCLWASRHRKKPCVYDAHEYFTEVPEVVRRPAVRRLWEMVARYAIPRMLRCYTVGPSLAALLSERYGKPFATVRNVPLALPANTECISVAGAPKILLYQGALNEGRGLEALIAAMKHIEGAVLWLAGEGDLSEALRQQANRPELSGKIRFLGYVLPKDLPGITAQACIGLNLLENKGLSYYYSLANKAFDYIQAGLPSIQMDFPEYRQLNDTWQVFETVADLEPKTLYRAIRKLLDDQAHYQTLHENCLKAARELTWEKEEETLINVYREVLPFSISQQGF